LGSFGSFLVNYGIIINNSSAISCKVVFKSALAGVSEIGILIVKGIAAVL